MLDDGDGDDDDDDDADNNSDDEDDIGHTRHLWVKLENIIILTLELYIGMGKTSYIDIFISSWGIKIRHPLELYIEMGHNMLDIFISSWGII